MEEDEDLKRAIALSLEESKNAALRRAKTPDSEDDDFEAQFQKDLQAAIEASKQTTASSSKVAQKEDYTPRISDETKQNTSGSSGLQSERSKMEQERLERLKRNRQQSEAPTLSAQESKNLAIPPSKKPRNSSSYQTPRQATQGQTESSSKTSTSQPSKGKERTITSNNIDGSPDDLFWDGELRQTGNRFAENETRPTLRLTNIIGSKKDITFAILSSFSNDINWLYGFFDQSTPIILVNQPGQNKNTEVKRLANNMLMAMPFMRNGWGVMHIKLLLLFYKDGRLRVVIPTANFMDYDWRDIENSVWVQDIPMRKSVIRHDPKAKDFAGTLQRVLHKLNVPVALSKLLDGDNFPDLPIESISELRMRWDWSNVKAKLVASLAGRYEGWDQIELTGHPALAVAIKELGAGPVPRGKELELEYQGSSIGSYTKKWMNEFYCSARGISARSWLDESKKQRKMLSWPPIKIIFPSLQTVEDSISGYSGATTMFCKKAQWESKDFPRHLFHDSNSKRARVMMHSKMIIGTYKDRSSPNNDDSSSDESLLTPGGTSTEESDINLVGWVYVGSHNFTHSAWGSLSGSTASPVLNITNFEMGVILPLKSHAEVEAVSCWKRPARKYVDGVDRAWIQEEMRR
ncbi:phospholipase D nuclease [Pyrrhoderma noxium]|uniref:Phospholipase D nuclease n=1 Tax=Pyrrhoderma noxium TaxID=2282107 RepID=A0A286U7Q8_9AGAM|nr:phospholipase D nuclease [Pyrrhoderma noxium]